MKLVFFSHPGFLDSQSMPRFTQMLANGMKERNHEVAIWSPAPFFSRLPVPRRARKWLGYIDQYILFPLKINRRIKKAPRDVLFVFADNALGPWVPLVANRLHVIHCHDFLAQRSALGEFPENRTGFSGKIYQTYINKGYRKGKNFISISEKTREDLHKLLSHTPVLSKVVYNGLNQQFDFIDPVKARAYLEMNINIDLSQGYILHVGGNQWYKNRRGVVEIFNAFQDRYNFLLPLLLIGQKPDTQLMNQYRLSPFKDIIFFLENISDELLRYAYAGASVFLFPSLNEGFGWPIVEAMASRCPVITTGEAPMTEVAGSCAFFIPRKPIEADQVHGWAVQAAHVLHEVIRLKPEERQLAINKGLLNVKRFAPKIALDAIEKIYSDISYK